MGRKSTNGNARERQVVAQEAARIIVNHGVRDYRVAKLKAAERLGLTARGSLPGNAEIEQAVAEHHQIFGGDGHVDLLHTLRATALEIMQLLAGFSPRLVGPVLTGTADDNSAINLHVFSDTPELVAFALDEVPLPYKAYERRLKARRDQTETYAGFRFDHQDSSIEATVFPLNGMRQAPISPVDGKPMKRADRDAVKRLIDPT